MLLQLHESDTWSYLRPGSAGRRGRRRRGWRRGRRGRRRGWRRRRWGRRHAEGPRRTLTHTCGNTKTQKSTNVTLQTRPCRCGCYSFSPCWSEAATATATSHHSMTSSDPSLSEQEVLSPPKRLQKHEAVAFFLWGGIGHVTSPPPSARPSVLLSSSNAPGTMGRVVQQTARQAPPTGCCFCC